MAAYNFTSYPIHLAYEGPTICTLQEKSCLDFMLDGLLLKEPRTLVGMRGMGKDVLYLALKTIIERHDSEKTVISTVITNPSEADGLIKLISSQKSLQTVLINLESNETLDHLLSSLGRIRLERLTGFIPLILSDVTSIYSSIIKKEKLVSRALRFLSPLNPLDSQRLIKSFEDRWHFSPSQSQKKILINQSGGHIGLLKNLFLLQIQKPSIELTLEDTIKDESVRFRLQAIIDDLPQQIIQSLITPVNLDPNPHQLSQQLGIITSHQLFSPLFSAFLNQTASGSKDSNENELRFSAKEHELLEFFKNQLGRIINREDIALKIWGVGWENRYSDWAIDQTIHRLRQKIKQTGLPFKLLTKKGRGFVLLSK